MKHVTQLLGLLLLLMVAQQGAVVHELSHFGKTSQLELHITPGASTDAACALCPSFAQVVTPAFSHAFHVPALVRVSALRRASLLFSAADAPVPRPRSRGPPFLS